jgi:hypothetical protein
MLFSFVIVHFNAVLFTELLGYHLGCNHSAIIYWKNVVNVMHEIGDYFFFSITCFLGDLPRF